MRSAMRALILLALPAVAFSWLLQVHIPEFDVSSGFVEFERRDYLLDAVVGSAPYLAVLAILAALGFLLGPRRGS
jgi:hypothetical protein